MDRGELALFLPVPAGSALSPVEVTEPVLGKKVPRWLWALGPGVQAPTFLICKMGLMVVTPRWQGCCRESMRDPLRALSVRH